MVYGQARSRLSEEVAGRQPARSIRRRTHLNILQVIPQMHAGGAERTVIEVAQAIVEDGGQAIVVSCGGRLVADLEAVGARHVTLDMKTKNPLKAWECMKKKAKRLICPNQKAAQKWKSPKKKPIFLLVF